MLFDVVLPTPRWGEAAPARKAFNAFVIPFTSVRHDLHIRRLVVGNREIVLLERSPDRRDLPVIEAHDLGHGEVNHDGVLAE